MDVAAVSLFFALLSLMLVGFIVVVGIAWVFSRSLANTILAQIRPFATEMAAAVAVSATAGSLYLSEVAGYLPCRLCWVQRGFMYPAALLLVVAAATKKRLLTKLSLGLALLGLPVAIFHRVEQAVGGFGNLCDPDNPCAGKWINEFGFVTIPTMAGIGFFGIVFFAALSLRSAQMEPTAIEPTAIEPTA